jgi:AraC family transcriptional regulator
LLNHPEIFRSKRPDCRVALILLNEALTLFNSNPAVARDRVISACTLIRDEGVNGKGISGELASWQIKRVSEFVEKRIGTKLRIQDVAAHLNYSPNYFSRVFRSTLGITYSQYVLNARLDQAKRLLMTTDIPICEVALICGLADQSHLTRAFSKAVGVPPSLWRRRFCSSKPLKQVSF